MSKSSKKSRKNSKKNKKGGAFLEEHAPRQGRNDEEYATFLDGHRIPRFQYTFPARRENETAYNYINRMRRRFTRVRESPIDEDYPYSPTPPSPSPTPPRQRRNRTSSAPSREPQEGRKKVKKSLNLALKGKHRRRRASAPSYGKKMSSVKARNWLLHERLKKSRKSRKSKKSKKSKKSRK